MGEERKWKKERYGKASSRIAKWYRHSCAFGIVKFVDRFEFCFKLDSNRHGIKKNSRFRVRESRLEQKLKETKGIFYVLFAFSVSVTILKAIVGRKQEWPEGVCIFPDLLVFCEQWEILPFTQHESHTFVTVSWMQPTYSTVYFCNIVLILSSHLCVCLWSGVSTLSWLYACRPKYLDSTEY